MSTRTDTTIRSGVASDRVVMTDRGDLIVSVPASFVRIVALSALFVSVVAITVALVTILPAFASVFGGVVVPLVAAATFITPFALCVLAVRLLR